MKRSRQRIIKLVTTVEVEKQDWGFQAWHPTLGLVATADTEDEVLDKMDKMVVQQVDLFLAHSKRKAAVGR
jgi:hypothetical protein